MIVHKCTGCDSIPQSLSGTETVCNCVANPEYVTEGLERMGRYAKVQSEFKEYLARRAEGP